MTLMKNTGLRGLKDVKRVLAIVWLWKMMDRSFLSQQNISRYIMEARIVGAVEWLYGEFKILTQIFEKFENLN